jgi:hypothetical protein
VFDHLPQLRFLVLTSLRDPLLVSKVFDVLGHDKGAFPRLTTRILQLD